MKTSTIIFFMTILFLTIPTIHAIAPPDEDPWEWWTEPPLPETGDCGENFTNITPAMGELWVNITAKGVQTCADITPPTGCNITVTYEWFNYTQFYDDWLDWAMIQPWGSWEDFYDWYYDIDFDSEPDPDNNSYWYQYSATYDDINTTTTICAFNDNVSCFIENDYTREYFDWRINYTVNCSDGLNWTGHCNYYFIPEKCGRIKYIYPPSPNGTACPCCAEMCISVNNSDGNSMNLTFYRNDSQFDTYYIINDLDYVSNGTYCFCIDGHNVKDLFYPNNYNTTYHWYVNITDTVTDTTVTSDVFTFRTPPNPSFCPCGMSELIEVVHDNGRGEMLDTPGFTFFVMVAGLFMVFLMKKRLKHHL